MDLSGLCPSCFQARDAAASSACVQCGWPAASADARAGLLEVGAVLRDRYVIGRHLGRGGFSITYLAWDRLMERRRAIKEYFPSGLVTRAATHGRVTILPGQTRPYQDGITDYLREARTLARFEGHPCIVYPLDFFEANGTAYLAMEYLEGETLRSYVSRHGGRIPYSHALYFLTPVIEALAAVHRAGIVHRDVSPDNVFLTVQSETKLLDFGAARPRRRSAVDQMTVVLREHFAPPEQYTVSEEQGPWTDVYAFAATLYFALSGEYPPRAPDRMMTDTLRAPSALGVTLPPAAEAILLQALSVRPRERPQSIEALLPLLSGEPAEEEPDAVDDGVPAPELCPGTVAGGLGGGDEPTLVELAQPSAAALAAALGAWATRVGASARAIARAGGARVRALTSALRSQPRPVASRAAAGAALALATGVAISAGVIRFAERRSGEEPAPTQPQPQEPAADTPGTGEPPPAPGRSPLDALPQLPFPPAMLVYPVGPRLAPAPQRPREPDEPPRSEPAAPPKSSPVKPLRSEAHAPAPAQPEKRALPADAAEQLKRAQALAESAQPAERERGLAALESLAASEYLPAQEKLGQLLALGTAAGLAPDDARALRWYRAAAHQGSRSARLALARRLELARWSEAPLAAAAAPAKKCKLFGILGCGSKPPAPAAAQPPDPELDFAGWLLAQSPGLGAPAELRQAHDLYLGLAREKVAEAQERLAYMLFAGHGGVPQRYDGFLWLRLAAQGNRASAQYGVGKLYLSGYAYPANRTAGVCWLQRAAAQSERARTALAALQPPAPPTGAVTSCDFPPRESPLH